ncbi:uncharacterized protein [Nicotiana sylvestris]|uniref:uncharacterized protein n=1 Tax=Nicotiana sylvestris TaxID=4096 RepID=UPI00388C8640
MAEYEACILGLKMAIDMNVQELLVIGDLDLLIHQIRGEWTTKNSKILPYLHHVQELRKRFTKREFQHVSRIQNEVTDALAILSSMIQHPDKNFIDPILFDVESDVMWNESYEIWPSAKYDMIIVAPSADELIHVKPKIEVRWLAEKVNVL